MRSKYNNIKVVVDGIKFDSIIESHRYLFLKNCNDVKSFSRQNIHVVSSYGKKQIKYSDDFNVIWKSGKITVEDVKGFKTPLYKLKKMLMAEKYGIVITEITKNNLTKVF